MRLKIFKKSIFSNLRLALYYHLTHIYCGFVFFERSNMHRSWALSSCMTFNCNVSVLKTSILLWSQKTAILVERHQRSRLHRMYKVYQLRRMGLYTTPIFKKFLHFSICWGRYNMWAVLMIGIQKGSLSGSFSSISCCLVLFVFSFLSITNLNVSIYSTMLLLNGNALFISTDIQRFDFMVFTEIFIERAYNKHIFIVFINIRLLGFILVLLRIVDPPRTGILVARYVV